MVNERIIEEQEEKNVGKPWSKRKWNKVHEGYEASRVWGGFRDEVNIVANDFENWESLKKNLQNRFDVHPSMNRFGNAGRTEILDQAKKWFEDETAFREKEPEQKKLPTKAKYGDKAMIERRTSSYTPTPVKTEPLPRGYSAPSEVPSRGIIADLNPTEQADKDIKELDAEITAKAKPISMSSNIKSYAQNISLNIRNLLRRIFR